MKHVRVLTFCDYPECGSFEDHPEGQDTITIQFWVYQNARGRKTEPIQVEVCEKHRDELRNIYATMQRYDQNKELDATRPDR